MAVGACSTSLPMREHLEVWRRAIMSTACPSLAQRRANAALLLLHEAATVDGLIGDGLVASHCRVTLQWYFLRTRSTAGKYPSGSSSFFARRRRRQPAQAKESSVSSVLGFDAPYLSDIFLQRPSSCGLARHWCKYRPRRPPAAVGASSRSSQTSRMSIGYD